MIEPEVKFDPSLCECCQINEGTGYHPCPYNEEINGDSETLCNCCEECEHDCGMEI